MNIRLADAIYPFTIAVISDSHVPTDQPDLPGPLVQAIRGEHPDLLLHAGDLCRRSILDRFGSVCPVYAVRGNRDIREWFTLPGKIRFRIGEMNLLMMHGEGDFPCYLADKLHRVFLSLTGREFIPPAGGIRGKVESDTDICISGHTHVSWLCETGGTVFLNPGCSFDDLRGSVRRRHSYAVIRLTGPRQAEIRLYTSDSAGGYSLTASYNINRNIPGS